MSNRNTRQPYRLHLSIRVRQRIQLHLHLRGLRSMKSSLIMKPLDILFHKERQLQRQAHPSIIQLRQPLRQKSAEVRYHCRATRIPANGRAGDDFSAPVGTEVVFRSVEDGDEDADDALGVCSVGVCEGGFVGGVGVCAGEEGAGEVSD